MSDGTGLGWPQSDGPCSGTAYRHLFSYPHHPHLQAAMATNREPMWYCHQVSPSPDPIPPTVFTPRSPSVESKCVRSWYVHNVDDSTRRSPDDHPHVQVPDPRCASCNGTFVEMASCIFRLQISDGRRLITSVVTDRKHARRPQNFSQWWRLRRFRRYIFIEPSRLILAHRPGPFPPQMGDLFPGPTPRSGGFTWSINRSSSPGGNTRSFVLGGPRQTDIGSDRVMPLTEYVTATAPILE